MKFSSKLNQVEIFINVVCVAQNCDLNDDYLKY